MPDTVRRALVVRAVLERALLEWVSSTTNRVLCVVLAFVGDLTRPAESLVATPALDVEAAFVLLVDLA